ncbi:MAG: CBM96 family carbohydrate-binding protein [Candidatus Thorarchaeota archaeon]
MNKSGVFLVIFLLLLGVAVVPTEPAYSATQIEKSSSVNEAAMATTGTLRIEAAEDVAVVNGTWADFNFDGDPRLYVGTSFDGIWNLARSFFKFDLSHLPKEMSVQRATMNVHIESEWMTADEPIGAYLCDDDSWISSVITWNNQPAFSSTPTDVIDSPASPNMFLPMHWYSWDVTGDVRSNLNAADMTLTEVLGQTLEVGSQNAFKYPSRSLSYPWNVTYLEIEYITPTTTDISVDGITSGPLLDYINNPTPDVSWTFSDPDYNDFQKDYDVEMWNNEHYNDTLLWQAAHEQTSLIHETGTTSGNWHPFGSAEGFRLQMKYPSSELPRSGVVDKLYFTSPDDMSDLQIENLEISLLMVESTAALGTDFVANYDGRTPTIVLSRDLYEVSVNDNTLEIDVENTFFVNEDLNLIVEIRLTNNTGDLVRLARTSSVPGTVATNAGNAEATSTTYLADRTYNLEIGFLTESAIENPSGILNGFPFGTTNGHPGRFQIKYNQSYIDRAGYLDRMYFKVDSLDEDVVYENFTVTLCETPVLGQIDHIDWTSNYGGATPILVLDESMYTVTNLGRTLVIDFDNAFYYSNTHDLLIDFQWDLKTGAIVNLIRDNTNTSSYRAWDVHWAGDFRLDNGTAGYDLLLDFVNNEESVPMPAAVAMVNATNYYLRVRTCDSLGMWGDWTSLDFKYEVITSVPSFTAAVATPDPVQVGQEVTVSINVTHALGINDVYLDFGDAVQHTMTADGDTYSYTWTPSAAGTVNYTIYMQSNANTWADVAGSVVVVAPAGVLPGDMTMILVIVGVAAVVVIVIIVMMKRKK